MPWLGTFYGSPVAVPCHSAFCLLEELQLAPRQRSFQATDVGVPFGLHRVHRVNELERDPRVGLWPRRGGGIADLVHGDFLARIGAGHEQRQRLAVGLQAAGELVERNGAGAVSRNERAPVLGQDQELAVGDDAAGREVGRLDETPAEPGKQLKLTVDLDLQIAAEEAIEGKNGAIVAMDPHSGEILAMVSRPTFDPNDFRMRISREEWNKLIDDPDKPLLNKAIQAQLAPGSTFKVIMSFAGWQEGIAQTLNIHCNGGATFYGRHFGCWLKGGHGAVDLDKGIYQSCDVFFYTLAEKLGIDRIAKYATMLGLGQKTGIDLPNEVSGVMPSEEWKIRNFKQKWFAGETISVGIGQGAVAITPVQLLRAVSAISMGGRLVVPHVINPTDMPPGYVE